MLRDLFIAEEDAAGPCVVRFALEERATTAVLTGDILWMAFFIDFRDIFHIGERLCGRIALAQMRWGSASLCAEPHGRANADGGEHKSTACGIHFHARIFRRGRRVGGEFCFHVRV